MKKYKILKTAMGSQDGIQAERFLAGTVRELSDDLAACFLRQGVARAVRADAGKPRDVKKPEIKMEPKPENKMVNPPENKGSGKRKGKGKGK